MRQVSDVYFYGGADYVEPMNGWFMCMNGRLFIEFGFTEKHLCKPYRTRDFMLPSEMSVVKHSLNDTIWEQDSASGIQTSIGIQRYNILKH